jgi:hypothetical protein
MTFKPTIVNDLTKSLHGIYDAVKKEDKSNNGQVMAEYFFWNTVASYAEKRSEVAFASMVKEHIIKEPKEIEEAGDHILGESKMFLCTVSVTKKIEYFDAALFAKTMNRKYKVPIPAVVQMLDEAKVPKSPRRTIKIVER